MDCKIIHQGRNVTRGERTNRICSGLVIFIKEDFLISNILSYSNSVCDTAGVYIPHNNLILITSYHPPNCSVPDIEDSIKTIALDWDKELKYNMWPSIVVNGHINFPSIYDWSPIWISNFIDKFVYRESRDLKIGSKNLQFKSLNNFATDRFLS